MSDGVGFHNVILTIDTGESLSDGARIQGLSPVCFLMPAAWDTANLTFQFGDGSGTYKNLYDMDGVEIQAAAAASRAVKIDPWVFIGCRELKVRSGTSGTPVTQSAGATILVVCREFE